MPPGKRALVSVKQRTAPCWRRAFEIMDPRSVDPVALGVLASLLALAWITPHPEYRPLFAALSVAGTAGTGWLWWRDRLTTSHVLVGAVVARIAFLPLAPSLSDDMYRYVWDGWLHVEGLNPYQFQPVDVPDLFSRQDELLERLNSSEYYSVYPPISQMIFALGATVDVALGGLTNGAQSYYLIKAILAALEVAGLVVIARLTTARYLVLYAWSPLVVVETAGQGHTEAALVLCLAAAVWCVRKEIGWGASLAVGAATMVKLYPVVLFPLLWRRFRWRGGIPGAALMLVVSVPYAAPGVFEHVKESLGLYVQLFEFNAGPYFAVKHALWSLTGTDYSKVIGPLLPVLWAGILGMVYVMDRRRAWTFEHSALVALSSFLVLSTTVHPWYLLAVLPLGVLVAPVIRRGPGGNGSTRTATGSSKSVASYLRWAWIWLSAFAPVTYLFYTGGPYWPWVVTGWAGGGAILLVGARPFLRRSVRRTLRRALRRRAEKKACRLLPYLDDCIGDAVGKREKGAQPSVQILDLGAAEGFVGEALRRKTNAFVQLCDVSDANETGLPHDIYDGRTLPYADQSMDVTVLYFVLHHCSAPERVIREALRVTTEKVLVVESVVRGPLQKRILHAVDVLANRLRAGDAMRFQESHLDFRRTSDWIHAVRAAGASVDRVEETSGWIHPQALLEVSPGSRTSESLETSRPACAASDREADGESEQARATRSC